MWLDTVLTQEFKCFIFTLFLGIFSDTLSAAFFINCRFGWLILNLLNEPYQLHSFISNEVGDWLLKVGTIWKELVPAPSYYPSLYFCTEYFSCNSAEILSEQKTRALTLYENASCWTGSHLQELFLAYFKVIFQDLIGHTEKYNEYS
jgi:hypothetical protein